MKENMQLTGKVVLITGAKGGLGTFVTNAFLESGARVAGSSRSIHDADFPHESFAAMPAELSSGEQARDLVGRVVARWGRIDVMIHLLGAFAGGQRVDETDDATLDRMIDLNFRSAFNMIRAVLPAMRAQRSGCILAVGSRTAVDPQPMVGPYTAAKAALVSLIRTVALENKDSGVTANVVLPGTMDTPANRTAMPAADYSQWVDPAQVADLLLYLASNGSSQISGAVLPVYGREL